MAKSIEQLNQQIARLQQQVEAAKAKEASGVIKRIREAIEHYGLTPEQLFELDSNRRPGRANAAQSASSGRRADKANKRGTGRVQAANGAASGESSSMKASEPAKKTARSTTAGVKLPAKYADENGNTWTGRGSTPRWLAEAIASGKTKEDFAVKA